MKAATRTESDIMGKAKELQTTTNIVKSILATNTRARNSDSFLYLEVLRLIGLSNGIDLEGMAITTFLLNMKEYGFPCFETVRRTRQKLQQHHPELAGDSDVEAQRVVNEEIFRQYARRVNI